jgi:hypothetical protein
MKYISVPKVDVNEGFRSGSVSKCALICFPDVFFLILKSRMHALTSDTQNFNGQEIYDKAMNMINSGQVAEAYDFLLSALPDEQVYYVSTFDKFKIKVGWWIFGGVNFRKQGGMLKAMNVPSKSKRKEMLEMYYNFIKS